MVILFGKSPKVHSCCSFGPGSHKKGYKQDALYSADVDPPTALSRNLSPQFLTFDSHAPTKLVAAGGRG